MRSIALSLALLGSAVAPTLAQNPTPLPRSPEHAATVATIGTIVPTVVGLGLIVSSGSEDDRAGVGYLVASAGVLLGPAIGNWSGGLTGRGFAGLGIRSVLVWGSMAAASGICSWDCEPDDGAGAVAVVLIGSTLGLAHAVWDVMTVDDAVARRNVERVSISPWISPTGATGVAVNLRF